MKIESFYRDTKGCGYTIKNYIIWNQSKKSIYDMETDTMYDFNNWDDLLEFKIGEKTVREIIENDIDEVLYPLQ